MKCGISTFSHSLSIAMKNEGADENEVVNIAMGDNYKNYIYPNKLKIAIVQYQAYTFK